MTSVLVLLLLLTCFSLMLNVIYYSKRHVDTQETRIFGFISFINFISLVLECASIFTARYLGTNSIFTLILNKGYLVSLVSFLLMFSLYVLNIAELGNSNFDVFYEKVFKIIKGVLYILFILVLFVVCLLDINIVTENNLTYVIGDAINLVYNVYAICFICCLVYVVRHFGNLKRSSRIIPVIIFILICIVSIYVIKINPGLMFIAAFEFLIVFIMYHTIENPDVKMLEKLEIAKREVENANSTKNEFLSSMSHEIRTPLNSIVGLSDCFLDSDNMDDIKNNAKDIVNASESLLEVINGILDVSKIESGYIELKNSNYNSYDTFKSVADLISPKMMGKGLDFTCSIANDVPKTLYGDSNNIKKIISNLLTNACKYTNNGFVKYDVSCVNSGDYVKLIISVEDSGIGIKRQDLDKLFKKFERLDIAKDTTSDGTGLGLAVIKQLTELMGGKVLVHSEFGKGTKFTILINQYIAQEDLTEEKKYKKMLDLTNVKILLVDDNNLNLKVSSKILEKYNANCITKCISGFECLDLVKNGNKYDVILLDDMMPKMSGVETLKQLKEIEGFNIPVVALTANAILGMKDKYIEAGFDDYLAKPINKNILIEVMNKILIDSVTEGDKQNSSPKNESIKKGIIPIDDNFVFKVSNMMDLTSEKKTDEIITEANDSEEETTEEAVSEIILGDSEINTDNSINDNIVYDEKYLEDNGVDLNSAIELLGDMEMFDSTLKDYLDETQEKWKKIVEYRDKSDMENYAIEVHALKSSSKYLGLTKLVDISYKHELKSKENDIDYVNSHFSELEDEFNRMIDILKNYSNK